MAMTRSLSESRKSVDRYAMNLSTVPKRGRPSSHRIHGGFPLPYRSDVNDSPRYRPGRDEPIHGTRSPARPFAEPAVAIAIDRSDAAVVKEAEGVPVVQREHNERFVARLLDCRCPSESDHALHR
jgi:hypothetical protein